MHVKTTTLFTSMLVAIQFAAYHSPTFAYQTEAGGSFGSVTRDGTVNKYTTTESTVVILPFVLTDTTTTVERVDLDETDYTFDVHGTYYLSDIRNQDGPRAYDAFLAKASFVNGELYYDGSGNVLNIGGRYLLEQLEQADGVFVEGGFVAGSNDSYTRDSFTISGGKYLTGTSTIMASLHNVDSDDSGKDTILGLTYQNLLALPESQYVGLTGGVGFGDYNYIFGEGEFFLTKDISAGAGLNRLDDDDYEHWQLSLFGAFFIEPNIKTYVEYSYRDIEAWFGEYDQNTFQVGVDLRF